MQAPARAREAPAPHGPGPRALRAGAVCYDAGRVRIHRAPAPSRLPTGWGAAVALVLLWWVMAVSSVGQKSTTFDELAHLTAGYSYWLTGDFRLQPENGNLPQRWAALPLLLGHYRFPSLEQEAWRAADVFAMGYHFFYDSGNDLDALLRAGRATMAVLGIALGLLVYAWSRRLFGATGGIVSVALYAFCPTLLANGPLATSDIAAALFFTASAWAVWALLHAVSPGSVLAAALAVAGLCLSKMSGILVVPMALVLGGIRLADGRPLPVTLRRAREIRARAGQLAVLVAAAAVQAAIVLVVVWAFYDFRYSGVRVPAPDQPPLDWAGVLPAAGSLAPLIELARRHHLLPEAYLYGLAYMRKYAATRAAFLNGRHSWVGWPSFFPYSLVVKTPLWLLGLVLAGAAGAILRRPGGAAREPARVRRNLYRTAPLWVLLGVYWASAIASHLNIGHRHLLPTYPAMLVLAGGLAVWLEAGGRAARLLIAAAALAYAVESALTWPNYLAYFNQLVGGPRHGYRHLVDSSLDWGQDLPGLARWLERNVPSGIPVYLSYFGTGNPDYYHIRAKRLPGFFDHWRQHEWYPLTGGVYAVSATMLQSVYSLVPGPWAMPYEQHYQEALADLRRIAGTSDEAERQQRTSAFLRDKFPLFEQLRFARLCAFLRRREPDDNVGYSILIYRLSDQDVREALYGPPAELLPDVGVAGVIRR